MDEHTFGEKISDRIANFGGSWRFIFAGIGFVCIWIIINLTFKCFDPYPFILLNLFLSLIAAFQAPFILMAQRRCEIKQDLIYRALFSEIKELVKNDLILENELIDKTKMLENEIIAIKSQLYK